MAARLQAAGDSHLRRVQQEAEPVQVGRLIAAVILGVFYVLGWLAAWACMGLGYCWASARLGWQDVYTRQKGRSGGGPA